MRYYTALELQKRKQRRAKTQAARKIQRWWRPFAEAFVAAREAQLRKETIAAVRIQRNWRRSFLRKRLSKDLIFLTWLKARRRHVLARFRRRAWLMVWRVRAAVKVLQKHLRRWWMRCLKRRALERRAATSIQRSWISHHLYRLQAPLRVRETEMIMLFRDEQLNRRISAKGFLRELELIQFRAKNPKCDLNEALRQTAKRVAAAVSTREKKERVLAADVATRNDEDTNDAVSEVMMSEDFVRRDQQRWKADSLLGYGPTTTTTTTTTTRLSTTPRLNRRSSFTTETLRLPTAPPAPSPVAGVATSVRRRFKGGSKSSPLRATAKDVTLDPLPSLETKTRDEHLEKQKEFQRQQAAHRRHLQEPNLYVIDVDESNSTEFAFYSSARSIRDPENWVKPNLSNRVLSPYSSYPPEAQQRYCRGDPPEVPHQDGERKKDDSSPSCLLVPNVLVWRLHKGSRPAGSAFHDSSTSCRTAVEGGSVGTVCTELHRLRKEAAQRMELYREDENPFEEEGDGEGKKQKGSSTSGVKPAVEVIVPRATGFTVTLQGRQLETHH